MKILIAYDGSDQAEAALDDLRIAGLPDDVSATVISVAEVWLPPPASEVPESEYVTGDGRIASIVKKMRAKGEKVLHEAETLAQHARERICKFFPHWQVKIEAVSGSASWEIIAKADTWRPDLIIMGSHGRSGIARFVLGSVSQRVLTEARCSVRIARGKVEVDPSPPRLVVGYDGSRGADLAVEQIVKRFWPQGTEVKIITVDDPLVPTAIGRFVPPIANWVEAENITQRLLAEKLSEKAVRKLNNAGLTVHVEILEGNPKTTLAEEANRWSADCIFMGAVGFSNKTERFLLGSISATVAERARCSVEVVR